ncbi:SAM-dependent methyltransferase [Luteimonas kalidii]|uniref:Class I SAM-dependent methyltransferase n=1 Tax=Luteimonas kalidii TaxID=3042025 RepID=A0ABT6JSV6_9GAMM|nr:class I SAM-dependent methyltransferase [Luteimonas kalidii]MDH5833756.1 class I SAM-dependent methyltransferase [Luteimonas kalidii]
MTEIRTFVLLLSCLPLLGACAEQPVASAQAPAPSASATAGPPSDSAAEERDPAPGMAYRDSYTREARPPGYRQPDVVYVPTPQPVVDAMLELAGVDEGDVLYDLGSGDGRIPITAARRFGIRAVGIDIEPVRIREANANARAAGVTDLVSFRQEDLFEADFGEASVVSLYLLQSLNMKLRPKLLAELRPGTRIVSHAFDMGEDWKPEQVRQVDSSTIYLWTVPER